MKLKLKIKLLCFVILTAYVLSACGEGGVDGTGASDPVQSVDLQKFQACFALAAVGDCRQMDFNGDSFINYADLSLMKSATRYDLNQDGYVDIGNSNSNEDRNKLNACLGSTAENCSQADFNGDKVVNDKDVVLFQKAAQFDLNNDTLVDLRDMSNIVVEYSKDLAMVTACLYKMPEGECATSDLNADSVIDLKDINSFIDAAQFDLNGDGIIDYSHDNTGVLANTYVNEDFKKFQECYFADTSVSTECVIADFNEDGIVNAVDFSLFLSSQKFDLDKDGFVDLRVTVESQDLTFIKVCFFQSSDGDCARADFNNNGLVNVADLAEFKRSMRFDLNKDEIVDLYGTETNSDLDIIKSCMFQSSEECLVADFNADGIINAADLSEFNQAVKYDLNEDGYVDFRVWDALASKDIEFINHCLSKPADGECGAADFNGDNSITDADMDVFRLSRRFDLDGDEVIDLNNTENNADLAIIKSCYFLNTADYPDCVAADFNGDMVINYLDLSLFHDSVKYDLNLDGFVDLREPAP